MGAVLAILLAGLICVAAALLLYARVSLRRKLETRFRESLQAFGTAFELRYPVHRGQTSRVVALSRMVGERMRLSERRQRDLELSAQLRDIGLCALPYSLLNDRPYLEWTEAEHRAYMLHPELSADMLEFIPALRHLAAIVRSHHLPYRVPGKPASRSLPIEARILKAVADLVWFEKWHGADAARMVREGAGTEYDPKVVAALTAVLTSEGVRAGPAAAVP